MKKILFIVAVFSIVLTSCEKIGGVTPAYEKFEGTYDVKSSGSINFFIGDTVFVNEPGLVVIKKGDNDDELFMYVETNYVTSLAPLGVFAEARVSGNEYEMKSRALSINIDLDGQTLSLAFNVNATGVLSEDGTILTSEVVFTGGITGTMISVGVKK